MKPTEFKKIIKEAVREVIQEELKEILLEAVRAPKINEQPITTPIMESKQTSLAPSQSDLRSKYSDVLGETAMSFTSQDIQSPFRPSGDPINGNLGAGEVGMDQIMNLLNTK